MGLLDEFKKYFALKGETLKKSEIVQLVSESTGIVPEKVTSFDLGAPETAKTYFGGAGNYTLNGVTANFPENLNIFFWDKEEWGALGIPIVVPPAENKVKHWNTEVSNPGVNVPGDQRLNKGQMWEAVVNTTAAQEPGVVNETIWRKATIYKIDPFYEATNLLTKGESQFNGDVSDSLDLEHWSSPEGGAVLSIENASLRIAFTTDTYQSSRIGRVRLIAALTDYYVYIKARLVSGESCDIEIGSASSIKGNGNLVIRPESEWKVFTGKINSTVLGYFGIAILKLDNTGATFEFDDIILSPVKLPPDLKPADFNGFEQDEAKIKVMACILRPNMPLGAIGGEEITWEILNTGNHKSFLATQADSSQKGNNLIIRYPPALNVINVHVTTDETFAKYGLVAGCSVAVDNANMLCYKRSNVGKIVSWDSANNRLGQGEGIITGDNCIAIKTSDVSIGGHEAENMQPDNDSSNVRLEYAGSNSYICRPYAIDPISGSKKFKVFNMVTGVEVTLTTLTTIADKFYLTGGISAQIIPLSVVSANSDIRNMQNIMFAPGCNFWVSGLFEY